ncbi:MAG: metal-dependent transcriptional regulator [Clostridia bacterium]|nr:metal-dependent transcriptional regulator [Clostridia bacterium]
MPRELSPAMEDYLLAIYRLESDDRRVTTGDIAQELGVSAASTTSMFKRLAQERLVVYREYGGVTLTEAGRASAIGLVRRHRLAERFLTDLLALPWDDVHRIADRLEHALPPEVIERFDGLLNHPRTCPHGHPIPDAQGELPERAMRPLSALAEGEEAVILQVEERDPELLRYFAERGLRPGRRVAVLDREPLEGALLVAVNGRPTLVSPRAAASVFVNGEVEA